MYVTDDIGLSSDVQITMMVYIILVTRRKVIRYDYSCSIKTLKPKD